MSKNNHTNPRPKLIEFKLRAPENANIRKARIDWLEFEILRLELNALLMYADTDYSVSPIPFEEQWRGEWEQNRLYVLKRIQSALGNNDIVATTGNIADALRRISNKFEAVDKSESELSARQFSLYDVESWGMKQKRKA